jgi:anti-sigma B factor antagonist
MKIWEDKIDGVDVLELEGRLDASSAKDIKKRVSALAVGSPVNLVIDMAGVEFMDSSGLGSLVAALRSVNEGGGDIKIACLQDPVRAIFELTRLDRIFEIFDDRHDAVKSF